MSSRLISVFACNSGNPVGRPHVLEPFQRVGMAYRLHSGLTAFGGVRDYNSNARVLQIDEIGIMPR